MRWTVKCILHIFLYFKERDSFRLHWSKRVSSTEHKSPSILRMVSRHRPDEDQKIVFTLSKQKKSHVSRFSCECSVQWRREINSGFLYSISTICEEEDNNKKKEFHGMRCTIPSLKVWRPRRNKVSSATPESGSSLLDKNQKLCFRKPHMWMINWLVLPCRVAAKADLVKILQCVGRAA